MKNHLPASQCVNLHLVSTTYVPSSTHISSMMEFWEGTLWLLLIAANVAFIPSTTLWESIQEPSDEWLNYQDLLVFLFFEDYSFWVAFATGREISAQELIKGDWPPDGQRPFCSTNYGYLLVLSDSHFQRENVNSTHPTFPLILNHAPRQSLFLSHSLCKMGSVCSRFPMWTSLFRACVQNSLLLAIWCIFRTWAPAFS